MMGTHSCYNKKRGDEHSIYTYQRLKTLKNLTGGTIRCHASGAGTGGASVSIAANPGVSEDLAVAASSELFADEGRLMAAETTVAADDVASEGECGSKISMG